MASMNEGQPDTDTEESRLAFHFVAELAQDVSDGQIELPAFSDVVVRVRRVLDDEAVGLDQICRVVGSEAGLAARVLGLANSAALNRSGKNVADLRTAIGRIGHNNVRTAAMSFAISRMRMAEELKDLAPQLSELWNEATTVAALSHALARREPRVNVDEALLAGLMHNVGKIYILARAHRHPDLFRNQQSVAAIMRSWHASIGKAIVENWSFPAHIADAVGDHEAIDRESRLADITDVLTVASMMSAFFGQGADLELNMQGVKAFSRMRLDNAVCEQIMQESAEEIAALRLALGD